MTAQATYTAHVVRGACCTGGRLCPTGRVLLLGARAEEARTEYVVACRVAARMEAGRYAYPPSYPDYWWRLVDATSISLDLAAAEASVERTRLGVAP